MQSYNWVKWNGKHKWLAGQRVRHLYEHHWAGVVERVGKTRIRVLWDGWRHESFTHAEVNHGVIEPELVVPKPARELDPYWDKAAIDAAYASVTKE